MSIDPFSEDWLNWLDAAHANVDADERLYLLLDGVFTPGLHQSLRMALPKTEELTLLFEEQSNYSDEARDVSPLLMPYVPGNVGLTKALQRCNGFPMVSAIVTTETLHDLTQRLAAWCIVKADDQSFNFRFPDTRRLPDIVDVLTPTQREELTGPASAWHYIDRDGTWKSLSLPQLSRAPADTPRLDATQFAVLVDGGLADETLLLLRDRGCQWHMAHSQAYARVRESLHIAMTAGLEKDLLTDWCETCMADASMLTIGESGMCLAQWRLQRLE